jgi:hypothetical protein
MKLITTHPDSNSIPSTWQQTGGIIFEGGIEKLYMKSSLPTGQAGMTNIVTHWDNYNICDLPVVR